MDELRRKGNKQVREEGSWKRVRTAICRKVRRKEDKRKVGRWKEGWRKGGREEGRQRERERRDWLVCLKRQSSAVL